MAAKYPTPEEDQIASAALALHAADTTAVHGIPDTSLLVSISAPAQGDVIYRAAGAWARLAAGTSGRFLKTQGAGADPVWADVPNPDLSPYATTVALVAAIAAHEADTSAVHGIADTAQLVTAATLTSTADGLVTLTPSTSARNVVQPPGAAVIPVIVKGAASQSADLQQWQNSAGTALAKVDSAGNLTAQLITGGPITVLGAGQFQWKAGSELRLTANNWLWLDGGLKFGSAGDVSLQRSAAGTLLSQAEGSNPTKLIVKGTASQSSTNLQEWQDSAASVVAFLTPAGIMDADFGRFTGLRNRGSGTTRMTLAGGNGSTGFTVRVDGHESTTPALVVKGVVSAAANLQEWQNSSAAVLGAISSAGTLTYNSPASWAMLVQRTGGARTWVSLGNGDTGGHSLSAEGQYYALYANNFSGGASVTMAGAHSTQGALVVTGGSVNGYVAAITAGAAGQVVLTAKGAASQTADLFQAQNSSAAVLAKVTSGGDIVTYNSGGTRQIALGTTSSGQGQFAGLVDVRDSTAAARVRIGGGTTSAISISTSEDVVLYRPAATVLALHRDASGTGITAPTMTGPGFMLANISVAPSTLPVGGGVMYVDAGAWRYRGTTADVFGIDAAGLPRWFAAAGEQTTVGAAGGASALPASPTKYLKVVDSAGTTLVIPAFAAA